MARKKRITKKEKEELKDLLLLETQRDDAGILELAGKVLTSDLHQNKIGRIRELVDKL
jgi:hypothetical protein